MEIDFSEMPGPVMDAFLKRRAARDVAEAHAAIERQAAANRETLRETRSATGLGGATMNVDPVVYHFWEKREGKGVWNDKTHQRLMRDAGVVIKPAKGTRVQVQVGGNLSGQRTENGFQQVAVNRWVKVYGG